MEQNKSDRTISKFKKLSKSKNSDGIIFKNSMMFELYVSISIQDFGQEFLITYNSLQNSDREKFQPEEPTG